VGKRIILAHSHSELEFVATNQPTNRRYQIPWVTIPSGRRLLTISDSNLRSPLTHCVVAPWLGVPAPSWSGGKKLFSVFWLLCGLVWAPLGSGHNAHSRVLLSLTHWQKKVSTFEGKVVPLGWTVDGQLASEKTRDCSSHSRLSLEVAPLPSPWRCNIKKKEEEEETTTKKKVPSQDLWIFRLRSTKRVRSSVVLCLGNDWVGKNNTRELCYIGTNKRKTLECLLAGS
jgi:hypothetical protein